MQEPWPRAIILVDMNAFFASVEQLDNPELRGRPVAITNGLTGTCIITSSYEARADGVKTGMRIKEARQLCPGLIQIPSHPERYAEISTNIMRALQDISPDVEVFSVDEAFLDVTHCQSLWGHPERIAALVKKKVFEASGILCSVGVSGDKTTAKWAAKQNKPDGLTVVAPWEAAERLSQIPVTDICGIAKGIGHFLAERGVYKCGDMAALPISELGRRFGNPGRRIWYMCQGQDPENVQLNVPPPKSMGHGKVLPPNTRDRKTLIIFLTHMSEKVAARLRRHGLQASRFSIGLRAGEGWLGGKFHILPGNDSQPLIKLCQQVLKEHWQGQGIFQVQLTALDPTPVGGQMDLFVTSSQTRATLNHALDQINSRYGEFAIAPAWLLERSDMPNVIAPAWKPFGHRKTI